MTTQQNEEIEFRRMFGHALSLYPSASGHEGSVSAYWQHLRQYSLPVLRIAFRRAVKSSPEFLPSAEAVRQCAESAAKTAQLERVPETLALPATREHVPAIGAGHEEWVNAGADAFEKLRRLWLVESKANGWDRGVPMSEQSGKNRWREFWATWEKSGSRTAPTSGWRLTGNDSPSDASGSNGSLQSRESSVGGLSHGDGCVCERCFASVMTAAGAAGLLQ